MSDAVAVALEESILRVRRTTTRPWLCFVLFAFGAVFVFAASGPVLALLARPKPRLHARAHQGLPTWRVVAHGDTHTVAHGDTHATHTDAHADKLAGAHADAHAAGALLPPPPPPPPAVGALGGPVRTVDAKGAADPGGAARVGEQSPLLQGMIEAGFSRQQAVTALAAVNASQPADVPRAIQWTLKRGAEQGLAEFAAEREVHTYEKMDFDGYAVVWGDKHRARSLEECGQKCAAWKPQPPSNFPCNVFVFCPLPKCYAPAALPPGSMTGQCWLKHQPDPNNPQVNMRGDYSEAYLRRHAGAPRSVQWHAGVVVRKGSSVDLGTWSSRANW